MGFYFGKKSLTELNTCERQLKDLARRAISGPLNFSIIEGHRNLERQQLLFRQGLSQIDGVEVKGQHNYGPSKAFDLVPYPIKIDGVSAWNQPQRFYMLAGVMLNAAQEMGIRVRWGGDWDGDGSTKDQTFHDLGHYELFN